MGEQIRKIIYFDKETIRNILQERNKGSKLTQTGTSTSIQSSVEIEAEASIKLNMPIMLRLSFLFTGRMGARFLIKRESETTITSTEISEFDKLKPSLVKIENTQLADIENSSTSFRVAGNYLRFVKGQVDDMDVNEFNAVMSGFEGYDAYKVDNKRYVRFNNTAFVSNYKRNDLLSTQMTLYCIKVGTFSKDDFDFIEQINRMQDMFSNIEADNTLADIYPSHLTKQSTLVPAQTSELYDSNNDVALFDVVYACISGENKSNEKERNNSDG